MSEKEKVYYFTNLAPHYRQRLWEAMADDRSLTVEFHFGSSSKSGIKEINFENEAWNNHKNQLHRIKNIHFFNRIVWQKGVIGKVVFGNIEKAMFLGDMNILSTWIASLVLLMKGSKVFFWGHGFRGDETFFKNYLRILFNKLAHQHFLYGHRAKELMIQYGFDPDSLHVVYNSLDYEEHLKWRKCEYENSLDGLFSKPNLPLLIFIGRLTPVKKLDLLIKAVGKLNRKYHNYNLLIIGDGEIKEELVSLAESELSEKAYYFYGACYDEKEIGNLLSNADLCVSPGNVGLTAIHSMSFGTPVCTHDNFANQMPEVEAVQPGETGCFFEEGSAEDLARQIEHWFTNAGSKEDIKNKCFEIIDSKYNPKKQMDIFKKVLLND